MPDDTTRHVAIKLRSGRTVMVADSTDSRIDIRLSSQETFHQVLRLYHAMWEFDAKILVGDPYELTGGTKPSSTSKSPKAYLVIPRRSGPLTLN